MEVHELFHRLMQCRHDAKIVTEYGEIWRAEERESLSGWNMAYLYYNNDGANLSEICHALAKMQGDIRVMLGSDEITEISLEAGNIVRLS